MIQLRAWARAGLASCGLLACLEEQYVSPDTVRLQITESRTSRERVNQCLYVPVLLGSHDSASYALDGGLHARFDVTREEVVVTFDGTSEAVAPFRVESKRFEGSAHEVDPAPPTGYDVELSSPCTPDQP